MAANRSRSSNGLVSHATALLGQASAVLGAPCRGAEARAEATRAWEGIAGPYGDKMRDVLG